MNYIAYCGLLCNECPVYLATIKNDQEAKEKLAKDYSNEKCQFESIDMNCFGCFSKETKNSKICGNCTIRNCAEDKDIKNCGHCDDYPCTDIATNVCEGSDNRKRLNAIKDSLN